VNGTIDDRYLEWLYAAEVGVVRNKNPRRSYWKLVRKLYSTPFVGLVGNDVNREIDGKQLRQEFLDQVHADLVDEDWLNLDCSVLEMLIGMARRVSFDSYGHPSEWFQKFLSNLEIRGYTDAVWGHAIELEVSEILDTFVNRKYDYDGNGGIFPLRDPPEDQRETELSYQMSLYIMEGVYISHGPLM
jgi:hypothetical protein